MENSHPKPKEPKLLAGLGWLFASLPSCWLGKRFSRAFPLCLPTNTRLAGLCCSHSAREAPGAQGWLPPTPGLPPALWCPLYPTCDRGESQTHADGVAPREVMCFTEL